LIILIILGEAYKSWSSSSCNFLPCPVTLFLFGPNTLLINAHIQVLKYDIRHLDIRGYYWILGNRVLFHTSQYLCLISYRKALFGIHFCSWKYYLWYFAMQMRSASSLLVFYLSSWPDALAVPPNGGE
jgi:hypothetical protein